MNGSWLVIIAYNHLNLPEKVLSRDSTKVIEWLYDATGVKLRKMVLLNGDTLLKRDYLSGLEFRNDTLEAIYHAEGRLYYDDNGQSRHEYNLTDHLGNTRLVFSDKNGDGTIEVSDNVGSNEVIQENHYYSFGMRMEGKWLGDGGSDYLFNGKELNQEHNLGWYDYGARWYDPSIGRWNAVDPLAEPQSSFSPYHYTYNNPVLFTDPLGLSGESTHTDSVGNVLAVYDDGDLGVYRHKDAKTKKDVDRKRRKSGSNSGDGERMGETEYWDEFRAHDNQTGAILSDVAEGARIYFGESWADLLRRLHAKAQGLTIQQIAKESLPGGDLDIKSDETVASSGTATGKLLNGKYATVRSAGNYLAGMNASIGQLFGRRITMEAFMKIAGALHQGKFSGPSSLSDNPLFRPHTLGLIHGRGW